jgi:hypothetical protein
MCVVCPDCGGTGLVGEGLLDPVRLTVLADALEERVGQEARRTPRKPRKKPIQGVVRASNALL